MNKNLLINPLFKKGCPSKIIQNLKQYLKFFFNLSFYLLGYSLNVILISLIILINFSANQIVDSLLLNKNISKHFKLEISESMTPSQKSRMKKKTRKME